MRFFIAWIVTLIGVAVVFGGGDRFMDLTLRYEKKWWGGLTLWMLGLVGVIFPVVAFFAWLVFWIITKDSTVMP